MKFKAKKSVYNLYGYNFPEGVAVEVTERNLIDKFKKYPNLKGARDGNKGADKKQSTKETEST